MWTCIDTEAVQNQLALKHRRLRGPVQPRLQAAALPSHVPTRTNGGPGPQADRHVRCIGSLPWLAGLVGCPDGDRSCARGQTFSGGSRLVHEWRSALPGFVIWPCVHVRMAKSFEEAAD